MRDSIALNKTIELMAQANAPLAKKSFVDKLNLTVREINVELSYISGGHTRDNIVAWISEYRVLFAGCMLKGPNVKSIGNTSDAELTKYPKTLDTMRQRYGEAVIVVPGHGEPGGLELT